MYNASQRVDNPLRIDEKVAVVPVAIVLELQFDERHRIFTPLDDNFTWLLAKAFVGNADAMYTLGVEVSGCGASGAHADFESVCCASLRS